MYKVRIEKFEGPFDLLIYLLENAKMDIYDIKVAEITEQYIDYLKQMEDLNIEVETEFIVLAAVLIRLKSHMLLPRVSDNPDDDVIVEDPRMELATRILDYMRTKKSAEMLQEREEYNLAIHEKPAEDLSKYVGEPDEILRATDEQLVNEFIRITKQTMVTSRNQIQEHPIPCNMINCFCMFSNYIPLTMDDWIRLDEDRRTEMNRFKDPLVNRKAF